MFGNVLWPRVLKSPRTGRGDRVGGVINLIILLLFYCGLSARPNETAIKCANEVRAVCRVPIVRFRYLYFDRFRFDDFYVLCAWFEYEECMV